jgi:ribonuclease BN (tRNA processing enzyme)
VFDQVVLLITHAHWDHIQGFPFFSYLFQTKPLLLFAETTQKINSIFKQMNGLNFPVENYPCPIKTFTSLDTLNKELDFTIECISTNHPGGCLGFRLKKSKIDVTYIPDNQLHNTTISSFNDFVEFCKETPLLIHDSQYTPHDMPDKIDWGHSIYTDTLKLFIESNAGALAMFHHDPNRTKSELSGMVNNCTDQYPGRRIFAAREGDIFDLLGI